MSQPINRGDILASLRAKLQSGSIQNRLNSIGNGDIPHIGTNNTGLRGNEYTKAVKRRMMADSLLVKENRGDWIKNELNGGEDKKYNINDNSSSGTSSPRQSFSSSIKADRDRNVNQSQSQEEQESYQRLKLRLQRNMDNIHGNGSYSKNVDDSNFSILSSSTNTIKNKDVDVLARLRSRLP
jgi:hypothetical protein